MSDEYTPSTEQVRCDYTGHRERFGSSFDRWLAAHDESVRAEERERIAQVIENYASSDFQTRRLAYEQAARLARGQGA